MMIEIHAKSVKGLMKFNDALVRHYDSLSEIERDYFYDKDTTSQEKVDRLFSSSSDSNYYIVFYNSTVDEVIALGYIIADESKAEFILSITPSYRGLGYGKELLKLMLEYCKEHRIPELFMIIALSNKPMLSLAKSFNCSITVFPNNQFYYATQRINP